MTVSWRTLSGAAAVALGVGLTTTVWAASPQDPATGGQLNKCWGNIIKQVAQADTPEGSSGGGMGMHARSTTAANINGGFASDDNAVGITLNELNAEGNHGRDGVGNVSTDVHGTHPGDGGNGQHAINNGQLAAQVDPVDGDANDATDGVTGAITCTDIP
jgi:hypothetical protein